MNIRHLIVCSTKKLLNIIQYYGIVNIKNLLAVSIIENTLDILKNNYIGSVKSKIKYMKNYQMNLIMSDKNICKLRSTGDVERDYRTYNDISNLEITVHNNEGTYLTRLADTWVFISSFDYSKVGVYKTDAMGKILIRNIETGNYKIWVGHKDDYKISNSLSEFLTVSLQKDVKSNIDITMEATQVPQTGTFRLKINDDEDKPIHNIPVSFILPYGELETHYTDDNGELVLENYLSGLMVFYFESPTSHKFIDNSTIAHFLDKISDNEHDLGEGNFDTTITIIKRTLP